jgi:hypothetical protein
MCSVGCRIGEMNEIVTDIEKYVEEIQERNLKDTSALLKMIEALSKESRGLQDQLSQKNIEIERQNDQIRQLNEQRENELNNYTVNLKNEHDRASEKYQHLLKEYQEEQLKHEQDVATLELIKQDQETLIQKLNEQEIYSNEKFTSLQTQTEHEMKIKNDEINQLTTDKESLQSQVINLEQSSSTKIIELEHQLSENQQNNLLLTSQLHELEKEIKALKKGQLQLLEENEQEKIKYNEKLTRLINENEDFSLQLSQCRVTQHDNVATHQLLDEKQEEIDKLKQQLNELRGNLKEKDEEIEKLSQDILTAKMESVKYYNEYDVEVKKVAQLTRALSATKMINETEEGEMKPQSSSNNSYVRGSGGLKFNFRSVADKMTHLVKDPIHSSEHHDSHGNTETSRR